MGAIDVGGLFELVGIAIEVDQDMEAGTLAVEVYVSSSFLLGVAVSVGASEAGLMAGILETSSSFGASDPGLTVGIVETSSTFDASEPDLTVGVVETSSVVFTSETKLTVGSAETSSLDSAETLASLDDANSLTNDHRSYKEVGSKVALAYSPVPSCIED